ncbi:hypothetical protein OG352_29930 [Streptomyces sp. NBC_01485]|nr:hypothetical protein [Streptomyces sp. NBC_01485]
MAGEPRSAEPGFTVTSETSPVVTDSLAENHRSLIESRILHTGTSGLGDV